MWRVRSNGEAQRDSELITLHTVESRARAIPNDRRAKSTNLVRTVYRARNATRISGRGLKVRRFRNRAGRKQSEIKKGRKRREGSGARGGKKTKVCEEIARGKGACNWTAKGTSASLAARPTGMVGRGATRRDAAAARHDAGATNETRHDDDARGELYLPNGGSHGSARSTQERGVRAEPRHDTEERRSAQTAAARRFPQEGGEAREKARRRRGDRGRPSRREGGRMRGGEEGARGRILSVID